MFLGFLRKDRGLMKTYSMLDRLPTGQASGNITRGCLVLEGGAFRGLYSQGAMDALMQNDINLECVIGVSAGALGGINYACGQIGRAARINLGYRKESEYIGAKALFKSGSIVNLDFCIYECKKRVPLNEEYLKANNRRYVCVATDCNTGKPRYYEYGKCEDIFEAMKASAAMPFISPMVDVEGTPCLDGGCSCKIGYQWALEQGYENIVVIRTREAGFRKEDKLLKYPIDPYRHYPDFSRAFANSNRDYNRQSDEIDRLGREGRFFVLHPSEKVTVKRLESDLEKLGELYWLGYNDALLNMAAIKKYLTR